MISLSSHVLDTTNGKPAKNMTLVLTTPSGSEIKGITNRDGRFSDWGDIEFTPGIYSLRFHCKEYLMDNHGASFYPHVDISFEMQANGGHYHVPLLISPYGFSSYRGS
jgi:5-hydroxyisourate hydrolase